MQHGPDPLLRAVLEAIVVSTGDAHRAGIDRVDDVAVFLVDDTAADFARAGQFLVIGVQFLVEQEEARMRCAGGSEAFTLATSSRISS